MGSMRRVKLGDVSLVEISGVDKKTNDGEASVRLCNFTDVYKNWAITSSMHDSFMVASANEREIAKFSLHRGQVAVTKDSETRDDIGIPTYIADNFDDVILGYHCALITPDEIQLNGKYLNAFLHTEFIHKFFSANASGSGQRYTLSIETLNSIPIYLPSLEEQERIGNIFSCIDRKIELNRQINDYLEAMAQQLYDYWFVQFDFPDEIGLPYKSSGGKMVWNEMLKREIPDGWEVVNIFEGASVLYGFPFSTESFVEETTEKPIVRIRDILDGSVSAYTTEDVDEKYRLNKGDVVIGMDGNFHMNIWQDDNAYLNQRCVRIRPMSDSLVSSIQIFYDAKPYIEARERTIKGSTVGHLSDKDMKLLQILVPKRTKQFNPRPVFDNIVDEISRNRIEISGLIKQRNELLPLLMNGQVSVRRLNNHLSAD